MKKSKITKDYQTWAIVLQVLSIMCTVVPLLIFSIIAFIKGEPLLLKNIKGGSIKEPCDYLCGKIMGIDYEIVK